MRSNKNKTTNKQTIITALLALVAFNAMAQTSFDPKGGCLNIIDFSLEQGFGEYVDRCISGSALRIFNVR